MRQGGNGFQGSNSKDEIAPGRRRLATRRFPLRANESSIGSMENATPADEAALMRRWVEIWKSAGPELERFKKKELRVMTEEEALQRVDVVMNSRVKDIWIDPRRRDSSGLVEQQRWFQKFRAAAK